MRNAFTKAMLELSVDPMLCVLTGDLGFGALESLQAVMGSRFINVGVAEQNMVGLACGLASEGYHVWSYSIAPFIYARAFEQIRNDACLHKLPVRFVGNGGGFAYGVMGATHHAIEDYGVLLCLEALKVFVPVTASDVAYLVSNMKSIFDPVYLRLGRDEWPHKEILVPSYAPWRQLPGRYPAIVLSTGALAGQLVSQWIAMPEVDRPTIWILSELPLKGVGLDPCFVEQIKTSQNLVVVEEHVGHGGVGEALAGMLLERGIGGKDFGLEGTLLAIHMRVPVVRNNFIAMLQG